MNFFPDAISLNTKDRKKQGWNILLVMVNPQFLLDVELCFSNGNTCKLAG